MEPAEDTGPYEPPPAATSRENLCLLQMEDISRCAAPAFQKLNGRFCRMDPLIVILKTLNLVFWSWPCIARFVGLHDLTPSSDVTQSDITVRCLRFDVNLVSAVHILQLVAVEDEDQLALSSLNGLQF